MRETAIVWMLVLVGCIAGWLTIVEVVHLLDEDTARVEARNAR